MSTRALSSWLVIAALAPACTTRTGAPPPLDAGGVFVDGGRDAGRAPLDSGPPVDGGPRLDDVLIYAHSRDTLYTFSPYTNTVREIGVFTLPSGAAAELMLDLAVDRDGNVFTCTDAALYRVEPTTARVTEVGRFGLGSERLFALTFVVPGALGASEVLVGATNEGVYYRIDAATARTTMLGRYPDGWSSSGDLVSVEGLGTFATVRRMDYPTDVLARIDFRADGSSAVTVLGATGYTQLFGLGYWGRTLYGFSNTGQLVEIDRASGAGTLSTAMTGTSQFWGAGVTTQVPVLF